MMVNSCIFVIYLCKTFQLLDKSFSRISQPGLCPIAHRPIFQYRLVQSFINFNCDKKNAYSLQKSK